MKKIKGIALGIAATCLASYFLPLHTYATFQFIEENNASGYGVLTEIPDSMQAETQILENGNLLTQVDEDNATPQTYDEIEFTPEEAYYRDYQDTYIIHVTPTNPDAFLALAEQNGYYTMEQEDGSYYLAYSYNSSSDEVDIGLCYGWKYEEAATIGQKIVKDSIAGEVTLLHGYQEYTSGMTAYDIRLFSTKELTEADFDGLGADWSVDLSTSNGVNLEYGGEQAEDPSNLYTFFTYCMTEVDGVYAVTIDPWYIQAIMLPWKYTAAETITADSATGGETAATTTVSTDTTTDSVNLCGDLNLDGVVDIADAVLLSKAVIDVIGLQRSAAQNADCDQNGTVDATDATLLIRFLIRLIDQLPVVSNN